MLRLLVLGLIMAPIIGGVMLAARVPDAQAALCRGPPRARRQGTAGSRE